MKYIDVSEHQGEIDWETVRGHVDGAILRAGYGRNNIDRQFARNAAACNRLGIPCGAYWFSYAKTVAEAEAEAGYLLAAAAPYRMALPLAYDFEYDSVRYAALNGGVTVTKTLASDMARAFLSAVEAGGGFAMLYANPDFLARYYDAALPERFALWLAAWRSDPDLTSPPRADCQLWQWTDAGSVPGIAGCVDLSESYRDFPALIAGAAPEEENSLPPEGKVPSVSEADAVETNGPLAAAVAWARGSGLLPAGADPEDTATLAAAAEMFLNYHRTFGGDA